MENVVQMIGSLGFPIVACLAMGWYVKYTTDQNTKEVSELRKEHQEEINKVTEALNNNTIVYRKRKERETAF